MKTMPGLIAEPTSVDAAIAQCALDAYYTTDPSQWTVCQLHCAMHVQLFAKGGALPDSDDDDPNCKTKKQAQPVTKEAGIEALKMLASGKKTGILNLPALLALLGPLVAQMIQALIAALIPTPAPAPAG